MSLYKTHQKPPILTSNYICSQRVIKRAINLETFFSEKITFEARKKRCIQKESIFHQKYQVNWESTQILRKAEEDREKVLNRRDSNCIRKRQNAVTNMSVCFQL